MSTAPATNDQATDQIPRLPARTHTYAVTTFSLKRACNGCEQILGDLRDRDVDADGNLTDVRPECPTCAPLVALEAAGCTTWRVTERSIGAVDNAIDRLGVYVKGYWQHVDGRPRVVGLRVGERSQHVFAHFGDWLVRHPHGGFTVHKGPQGDTAGA